MKIRSLIIAFFLGTVCAAGVASLLVPGLGGSYEFVARVPILDSCADDAITRIDTITDDTRFRGSYHPFDFRLPTHPRLAGFVVLESNVVTHDDLVKYANAYSSPCITSMGREFRLGDPSNGEALFMFLGDVNSSIISFVDGDNSKLVDPNQVYLVIEGENVTAYFEFQELSVSP